MKYTEIFLVLNFIKNRMLNKAFLFKIDTHAILH